MGGWAAYLASTKGIIVAMIDGRGSGNNGDRRYVLLYTNSIISIAHCVELNIIS